MTAEEFKNNITIYLLEHKFGKIDVKETLQAICYEAEAYADKEKTILLDEIDVALSIISTKGNPIDDFLEKKREQLKTKKL